MVSKEHKENRLKTVLAEEEGAQYPKTGTGP